MATDSTLVRASVHAGGTTTNYFRAGSGDVVVLLDYAFADVSRDSLLDALATTHRVIVPEISGPGDAEVATIARAAWLRSFLDGLGVDDVSIVARDECALTALAYALTDFERVRSVVLLIRDASDPASAEPRFVERVENPRCRILVASEVPEPGPPDERASQIGAIVDFLAA